HQRSMHAAIDRSWQLLDDAQRATWSALSVFRGGFTLDGARAVLADLAVDDVAARVSSLVARSLVVLGGEASEHRFAIDHLLRRFAADRLAERDPAAIAEGRHAAFILDAIASVPDADRP